MRPEPLLLKSLTERSHEVLYSRFSMAFVP